MANETVAPPSVGLYSDDQIRSAIEGNSLLDKATVADENIRYATYEVRIGNTFERIEHEDEKIKTESEYVDDGGYIFVDPGETVRVYTKERFILPNNVFARVTTLGQIFSSGFAAENTYVDPGFNQRIYITLTNISDRRLKLKSNSPLARVEFHKLERAVSQTHGGEPRKFLVGVDRNSQKRHTLSVDEYATPHSLSELRELVTNTNAGRIITFPNISIVLILIVLAGQYLYLYWPTGIIGNRVGDYMVATLAGLTATLMFVGITVMAKLIIKKFGRT